MELSPEELQKEGTSPSRKSTENQGDRTANENPTTTEDGQPLGGSQSVVGASQSVAGGQNVVVGSKKIFFVGGLDDPLKNYFDLNYQAGLVKKGWSDADIVPYRHVSINGANKDMKGPSLFSQILQNPNAPIMLFSAGCKYCLDIAKFLKQNKLNPANLYINEPYTPAGQGNYQLQLILDSVKIGVPIENVFVGTYPGVGSNIPGNTTKFGIKTPGMGAHWEAVTVASEFLKRRYANNLA